MKIDLHLHSKFSTRPSQWFLQKSGCPESFSEPEFLYQRARQKGMTAFTLTDHNTIDGCLTIVDRPGVFVSEEITTYFPENRCKVHVLAWNIDRSIHEDIQPIRENIYRLAAYLRGKSINHALAHPLFSINNKLTVDLFEKFLLLFKNFEMNGARDEGHNQALRKLLAGLDRKTIDRLAEKHGIEPAFERPWVKHIVGGSDDHSALNVARIHTRVPRAVSLDQFFEGLHRGQSRAVGTGCGPKAMAHNIYGIAYQFCDSKLKVKKYAGYNRLISLVDKLLSPQPQTGWRLVNGIKRLWARSRASDGGGAVYHVLQQESERLILDDPTLRALADGRMDVRRSRAANWFNFAARAADMTMARCINDTERRFMLANPFSLLPSLSAAGLVYFLLAPYFVAFNLYSRDRFLVRAIMDRFGQADRGLRDGPKKIALFTDSRGGRTLSRTGPGTDRGGRGTGPQSDRLHLSARVGRLDRGYPPVRPGRRFPGDRQLGPGRFHSAPADHRRRDLPARFQPHPGDYSRSDGPGRLHRRPDSGPAGPRGPTIAGVHQDIAQAAGDETVEQLIRRFFTWYYNQMDLVVAPDEESYEELQTFGIGRDRISVAAHGGHIQ